MNWEEMWKRPFFTAPSVEDILAKYSTPNLRKNELTRNEKREHLIRQNIKGADANKILDELYGPLPDEPST